MMTTKAASGPPCFSQQDIEERVRRLLVTSSIHNSNEPLDLPFDTFKRIDTEPNAPITSNNAMASHDPLPDQSRPWDCLDTADFLLNVESQMGLRISDDVADSVQCPSDLVKAVAGLLKAEGRLAPSTLGPNESR